MAVIPRYDQATVGTDVLPTPRVPESSPSLQAMGNLGQSLQGVGQEAMQLAAEAKRKADASAVMEAQVSLNQATLQLQTQALQRQGHDALDNKPLYDQFDKIYGEASGGLKNDQQRYLFHMQTANDRNHFALALERHAAEQGHALAVGNANALVSTDMQKLSTLFRDDSAFDQQLKQTQAHVLDALHMQGLSDSDEAAKAKLAEVRGKAWAERIQSTMHENPAQALHLFEVHQDELEPQQREVLEKAVRLQSAEAKGRNAAFGMLPEIKGGAEMTDLIAKGRSELGGDEEAFGKFQQELEFLHTRYNQEKKEKVDNLANDAYGSAIDFETANGRPMSGPEFVRTREFQSMHSSPEAQKAARAALDKVNTQYRAWESDQRKIATEIRRNNLDEAKLIKEARQERQDKALSDLMLNPDAVATMTNADLRARYPDLGHANFIKLMEFKKGLSSPEKLADAKIDVDLFNDTMRKIGVDVKAKDQGTRDKVTSFHARFTDLVAQAQKEQGRKITREEKKKLILEAATTVPVRVHRTIAGFGAGYTTENTPLMDVQFKGNIQVPDGDRKQIIADFKTRFRRAPTENEIIDAFIAKSEPE